MDTTIKEMMSLLRVELEQNFEEIRFGSVFEKISKTLSFGEGKCFKLIILWTYFIKRVCKSGNSSWKLRKSRLSQ